MVGGPFRSCSVTFIWKRMCHDSYAFYVPGSGAGASHHMPCMRTGESAVVTLGEYMRFFGGVNL